MTKVYILKCFDNQVGVWTKNFDTREEAETAWEEVTQTGRLAVIEEIEETVEL